MKQPAIPEWRQFYWLAAALFVLALSLRVAYFLGADVERPIVGDIQQYVCYAWNMVYHGVFSSAAPAMGASPAPDAYRGPGYPAFLALWLWLAKGPGWYQLAVAAQMVISASSVLLTIALARLWMSRGLALLAGALVALWPHLIVFASTLLAETLFGFLLLLMLLLVAKADDEHGLRRAATAALVAGLAYLVNPLAALLPLFLSATLFMRKRRGAAMVLLVVYLPVVIAWGVRGHVAAVTQGSWDRVAANFVQGSWPQLYKAYNSRLENEISARIMEAIADEERLMVAEPAQGLAAVFSRMRTDPAYHVKWYALQKPWLLWSWSTKIGWGDVYFTETHRSPFERQWVFRAMHAFFSHTNPLFFLLALGSFVIGIWKWREPGSGAVALFGLAFTCGYFTVFHVLLQGEPRYSVAYRPMEVLLAVFALSLLARGIVSRRPPHVPSSLPAANR